LVMLAQLRRWWCLSGRDEFGALSLSCRACERGIRYFFVEVKCLFSTTPVTKIFSKSSWIETETNRGQWGDRSLDRTWSRHNRTRPVSDRSSLACGLGFTTGSSGHSWDRRVRSGARGTTNAKGSSDAVARPITIDRMLPIVSGSLLELTGRWHCGVRSVQAARPVV
jgi:hypothetical protein